MKVLQINNAYPSGSTGKIVLDIHRYLTRNGHQSMVVYGVGSSDDPWAVKAAPELVRKLQSLRSRFTGYPYGGCLIGTHNIISIIKDYQPELVHLHCINAYMVNIYKLLDYLKKNNIPTVLTLHAEFMYTSGCSYSVECDKWLTGCHHCNKLGQEHPPTWFFDRTAQEWRKMQQAYSGFDKLRVCAVSDWVRDRARLSPFYQGRPVETVLNGLNTDIFHYVEGTDLHKELKIPAGAKVVIHATPDFASPIKGGEHVLEMVRRFANEDVYFVVIGAKKAGRDGRLITIPHTKDQNEQVRYYSMADLCLLTSLRETFSMVCAESLCCGTPVVGFEAGAPETITIPEYSEFVTQGDDDRLETAIRSWLMKPQDKQLISQTAQKKYSNEKMCSEYLAKYEELIETGKG